jgi:transcriptional regulator with XRE-family HTH domain
MKILGLRVQEQRKRRGFGLREFAEGVGVSPSYLCDLESGRREFRGPKSLEIAFDLGFSDSDVAWEMMRVAMDDYRAAKRGDSSNQKGGTR